MERLEESGKKEMMYKLLICFLFLLLIPIAFAAPGLTVSSPSGNYQYAGYLDLNYSVSDSSTISRCWYSLDSGLNFSPAGNNTYSMNFSSSSTQFLSVDDTAANSITGNLTLEAWVKFNSLPASDGLYYIIASKYMGPGFNKAYILMLYNDANVYQLRYYNSNDGSDFRNSSVTFTPTLGIWYHVATVYDASNSSATFYVNGASRGKGVGDVFPYNYDSASPFAIGSMFKSDGAPWGLFDGRIDDVRLWNYTRTSDQILRNYNHELIGDEPGLNGYWKLDNLNDSSSYGQTLYNNNSVTSSTDIPFPIDYQPASIRFTKASTQYVAVQDSSSTSITRDFSAEAIVNFSSLPKNGDEYTIFGKWKGQGNNKAYLLTLWNASGTYKLDFYISYNGSAQTDVTADWKPALGRWYLISVAYNSSANSVDYYINGTYLSTATGLPNNISDTAAPFSTGVIFGTTGTPSLIADTTLDELRLWNDYRTAAEIGAYNNTELMGNESNLVGYWKFDYNLQDQTNNSNDFTSYGAPVFYSNTSDIVKLSVVGGSCVNTYLNVSEAAHTLRIYVNNSLGSTTTRLISFINDLTNPIISFSGGMLSSATEIVQDWIFANVSVTEANEQNITFSLFDDASQIDLTIAGPAYNNINWTGRNPGTYYYNVSVNDSSGRKASTETRSIVLKSAVVPGETSAGGGGSSQGAAAIVELKKNVTQNALDKMISADYVPAPCSLTHLGECVYPKEPIVGWIISFGAVWFIYSRGKPWK